MIWITADTHFGHTNIIEYCRRPFNSVSRMDSTIIANWNRVVAPEDIVYHLGDFALTPTRRMKQIAGQLNGHIIYFIGNHDRKGKIKQCGFDEIHETLITKDNFILSHTPIYIDGIPIMNVGVDVWNFTPIPFPTATQQMVLCGHVHENWMWFIAIKGS